MLGEVGLSILTVFHHHFGLYVKIVVCKIERNTFGELCSPLLCTFSTLEL
jgi:hypothetical protein